ncbi:signal transduction histidine kinase [Pseudomonas sp. BIGb0450]|uniref:sensor histidine kinase n=1 Tax=unclassified Pseudomonas TaxID=196821 RepID=UPI002168F4B6|nr:MULTISPECIES: HAMP domain-containing sensor histidine kinase [unclassified Pseudomonas]MCS3417654.1 signal transduction histidine kinase [Pseudomonas sp. BIGb0558]MCS3436878.1 signal transduction histidine kinase [Pseudomonas sp. BIGb0450]
MSQRNAAVADRKGTSSVTGQAGVGFRVAARTLIHLGRELISSDEIAINELIKNAFDAGSEKVGVRIICPISTVDLKQIINDLLDGAIAFPERRDEVLDELVSLSELTELGSETVAHLQSKLDELQQAKTLENFVSLLEEINFIEVSDAGCGIQKKNIYSVFLTVGTDYKVREHTPEGVDAYLGNKGIGRLSMMRLGERAQVTTWTASGEATLIDFDWRAFQNEDAQVSDIPVSVSDVNITSSTESGTVVRVYALNSEWSQSRVEEEGLKTFIRRLRNPFNKGKKFKIRLTVNDNIPIPFSPLSDEIKKLADQHLTLTFTSGDVEDESDALITIKIRSSLDGSLEDTQVRSAGSVCKKFGVKLRDLLSIGPFSINILRLNRRILKEKVKQNWVSVRRELDTWSGGIAIYRDGFRVGFTGSEQDGDWLGLDHKAIRGGGYIVNRIQVIGALEITHDHNRGLVDLTNREGLVDTPEARLLKELLLEFAINPLRSLVEEQDEKLKSAALERLVNDGTSTLNDRLALAKRDVSQLKANVPKDLKSSVNSLDEHLHFISTQVKKFENAIEKVSEGREDILELAGIGNVMHGVMHELTRTTAQTRKLMVELAQDADGQTKDMLNKLEGEIKAINTRLKQLDPLMPGARHSKADIDVVKLSRTVLAGYASRFERHNIEASITVDGSHKSTSVKVRMVPGFLSLALENIISNAVYWVGQRKDPDVTGRIDIEIDSRASTVSVTDNGTGVDYADRERIFQPGFSLREKGKGYGLYLAREVAEYHGGKLFLDPDSDKDGHLHTFTLELPRI